MALSSGFLDYVLEQFETLGGVSSRRMFGGAGLYRDGLFFGLVSSDVLYLKADDENRPQFEAVGAAQFNPFPDKPGMGSMSYYAAPVEVLEQPDELAEWARRALGAAARKPTPKRGPRARR
ncbi:MAG TPA: TfoX/Sxy family protein [Phenylobacterium sp.]